MRILGLVVYVVGAAFFLTGLIVLTVQIADWLYDGLWLEVPVLEARRAFPQPWVEDWSAAVASNGWLQTPETWKGLQLLVSGFFTDVPLSLVLLLLGLGIVSGGVRILESCHPDEELDDQRWESQEPPVQPPRQVIEQKPPEPRREPPVRRRPLRRPTRPRPVRVPVPKVPESRFSEPFAASAPSTSEPAPLETLSVGSDTRAEDREA